MSGGRKITSVWVMLIIPAVFSFHCSAMELHRLLSSETLFLHELNYIYDLSWDADWLSTDNGFRTTAGSISSDRFLFDVDGKFTVALMPHLRFSYRYHISESYIWDREDHLADLAYCQDSVILGICGMVRSLKEHNNIGLLAGFAHDPYHRCFVRITWPDLYFNQKGPDDSEYLRPPFEVLTEGVWRFGKMTLFGDIKLSRKWIFQTETYQQTYQDQSGRMTVKYEWETSEISCMIYGQQYRNNVSDTDTPETEEADLLEIILGYHRWITMDLGIQIRTGYVSAQGKYTEIPDQSPQAISFTRHDELLELQLQRRLNHEQEIRLGVITGLISVTPDDSIKYDTLDLEEQYKITGEYVKRFQDKGDIILGLSYNITDRNFGGGNLRLRVFF
ncbi:hypothetical protein JW979_01995 [bacterium]|nr:hypothetical protein [candidate division CSSED10-310 bacterium]